MTRAFVFVVLVAILMADLVLGLGVPPSKDTTVIRAKRQYLGYPYGMGYPYTYGYGYNPMVYRPIPPPMYGMPYYRPYGFWG